MHGGEPPGGVERAREQSAGAGRFDQADAAVDDRLVDPPAVAEVEHRRLGQAADDLVGRGDDDVGAGAERVGGQVGVEAQVGAPGLVDGQRHAAPVGDLGEAGDVRAGAEVGRRDDHRRDRARRRVERRGKRVGRQAVGDPQLRVDLRSGEARPQAAEHEPVDHRGVDVALDDDPIA